MLVASYLLLFVVGTSTWRLEAPVNGSVSPRPSWRFFATGVPETAELCVTLIDWPTRSSMDASSAGGRAQGCFASAHGGRAQGFVAMSPEQWGALGSGMYTFDVRVRGGGAAAVAAEDYAEALHLHLAPSPPPAEEVNIAALDYAATAAAYADIVRRSVQSCACVAGTGCERLAPGGLTPTAVAWRANEWQHTWLLARLFSGVYSGTFVEVGAADVYSSVTDVFERYFCWTGIGVEPLERWARSNVWQRPFMLSVHGALCGGEPGLRAGFVDDGHYSGFAEGKQAAESAAPINGGGAAVRCHRPSAFFTGVGVHHIDLFILDCEGCERDVLAAFDFTEVDVEVWVVEGNHPVDTARRFAATHELIACIGEKDMVFVRRGSAAAQRWRLFAGGAALGGPSPDAPLAVRCPMFAEQLQRS